ncbi:thiol-disulfide oxidoreductase DCC family protein [Paenibacillus puldeungensis]|uniref:Thiol-disulfide oxidoreductase DCC family protein n=1 Tax=Paenibacillus puldeungensis TaxID=696536 RepID=A0ABW3RS33_9BACL
MKQKHNDQYPIVLFDGVCHLCQGAIKFIIKRDDRGRFRFAALQSEAGRQQLQGKTLVEDTIVLVENDRCYTRSTAALRIVRKLRFPWPLLYFFIIIPPVVRDGVYRFIAAHRYRWFGKDETCLVPTKEIMNRFL